MALVRLKRAAQITPPAELHKEFHLEEGSYLEAEAVEGGILLKPVAFIERQKVWEQVRKVLDRVHAKLPQRQVPVRARRRDRPAHQRTALGRCPVPSLIPLSW
jgi:bifunctional DNA-binding transcriptional regulator/antitoxin component of YhaV-PrlF toxin-antitoxin module